MKGKKGAIALKMDLHKAFDSVNWSFLEKVLRDFNIPEALIKLIMFCVSTVKLSMLWNGEPLPFFDPQRGLRQGDPLSPYLFIMVMEKLSHMILSRLQSRSWKPIKIARGGLALSHLFFADDLMLFCKASHSQLSMVMNCLKEFAGYSGLEINLAKSKLYISPNIQAAVANSLSSACDIPLTSNLGTYLGVPIIHGRNSATTYKHILERMQLKLANWKRSSLSLASRKTLIQSATSSILVYTMQIVILPQSICSSIDKINRNFLWGSDTGTLKPHLVSWEAVCKSQEQAMASNIFVQTKVPIWISWHPPDPPFCKLNTDGSRMQETGLASTGGLLQDSSGTFIQGFSVNIGQISVFLAELWGCREGLILCRNKGISHLVVEMDSLSAVQVIEGSKEQDSLAAVLVEDIRRLRGGFIAFSIQHTLHEGNRAADFMAEIEHNLPTGTTVFYSPPLGLITFLEADTLGVAFLRH
ncbi:hypothetical protein SLEP1_g43875 [Rubroshorea leprosula]|uniref:Reverse transcriptase domain-containing protein n=1 Tax=Rubroshorea leprosula TaxID=152421 RepID=A0AAV5LED4_9ROSI|nr:hypothetical protein SLEP1_g43875 [Rubroshorea leprosula]